MSSSQKYTGIIILIIDPSDGNNICNVIQIARCYEKHVTRMGFDRITIYTGAHNVNHELQCISSLPLS
jgi:hypothetical protein